VKKNERLAALLNVVLPFIGAGYIYLNRWDKFALAVVLWIGVGSVFHFYIDNLLVRMAQSGYSWSERNDIRLVLLAVQTLWYLFAWIFVSIDGYRTAKKRNKRVDGFLDGVRSGRLLDHRVKCKICGLNKTYNATGICDDCNARSAARETPEPLSVTYEPQAQAELEETTGAQSLKYCPYCGRKLPE
jgi:hypothetical protein